MIYPTKTITVTCDEFNRRCGELMTQSQEENVQVNVIGSSGKITAVLYSGKVDLIEFADNEETERDRQKWEEGWRVGYVAGGEAYKKLALVQQKSFRHQGKIGGMSIQVEGFIEAADIEKITCNPDQLKPPTAKEGNREPQQECT